MTTKIISASPARAPFARLGALWSGPPPWLRVGLAAGLLAVLIAPTLVAGPLYITGNVHDIFIPINAALARDQGLELYREFASPFGPLYFVLASLALKLSPALSDINGFMSLVFLPVLLAVFFWARALAGRRAAPLWLLCFLVILIFAPRGFYHLPDNADWYGMYNRHLWSLLLVALTLAVSLPRRAALSWPRRCSLAGFFGCFLVVCFYYKMNFFLAGCAVFLSLLIVLARRDALIVLAMVVGLGVGAGFAVEAAGISNGAYLGQVLAAIAAKTSRPFDLDTVLMLVGVVCAGIFLLALALSEAVLEQRLLRLSSLFRFALISGAVCVAMLGDFRLPVSFYLVALVLVIRLQVLPPETASGWRRTIAVWAVVLAFLPGATFDAISLGLVGVAKVIGAKSDKETQVAISRSGSVEAGLNLVIGKDDVVHDKVTYGFLLRENLTERKAGLTEADVARILIRIAFNTPDTINFSNLDYVHSLAEAAKIYRALARDMDLEISTTEFTNPFPALLRGGIPAGSLHWIHPGTTVRFDDMRAVGNSLETADVVLIPVFSVDSGWRARVNATFLPLTGAGGKFCHIGVSYYWVHYIRCAIRSQRKGSSAKSLGRAIGGKIKDILKERPGE